MHIKVHKGYGMQSPSKFLLFGLPFEFLEFPFGFPFLLAPRTTGKLMPSKMNDLVPGGMQ